MRMKHRHHRRLHRALSLGPTIKNFYCLPIRHSKTRRRKRPILSNDITNKVGADENQEDDHHQQHSLSSLSFATLVSQHRFVCFFVIQDDQGPYYSHHVLTLRHRLATEYHDCMTVFVVSLNHTPTTQRNNTDAIDEETTPLCNDNGKQHGTRQQQCCTFMDGTGFIKLVRDPSIVMTLLNVSQIPTLTIIDTVTGRPIPLNAALALEWNEPHNVLQAWHMGQSGLSISQQLLAIVSCQSHECTIL